MTIQEHEKNIMEFAEANGVIFDKEGECGFGRECVGLRKDGNWIDFNPHNSETYSTIEEYYDDKLHDIAPENAYHKHNCLAVLGRGDEAIIELSEWVTKLREMGAKIVKYNTGSDPKGPLERIFKKEFLYTVKT